MPVSQFHKIMLNHKELIVPISETVGHGHISPLSGPTIPLSPLDQVVPRLFISLCLCFPYDETTDKNRTVSVLKEGLRQTITALPFLAADLVSTKEGRVELAPGHGVLFIVKDLTKRSPAWHQSYTELDAKKMPLSEQDYIILAPDGREDAAGGRAPVMAVQVNFIQGGLLLCAKFQHSVLDGAAVSVIFRAWARNCREWPKGKLAEGSSAANTMPKEPEVTPESLDKSALLEIPPSAKAPKYNPGNRQPQWNRQQALGSRWLTTPTVPPLKRTIFHFSATSLKKLKADLSSDPSMIPDDNSAKFWISTTDAVGALLWCCIDHARYTRYQSEGTSRNHQESTLGLAVNARARLEPPLPSTFLGNVVLSTQTKRAIGTPTTSLLHAAAVAARRMGPCVTTINDKHIRMIVANIKSLPDPSVIAASVIPRNNDSVFMSSSANFDYYGLDWGTAIESKMAYYRSFTKYNDGFIAIHPRLPNGSLEVLVLLREDDMKCLQANEVLAPYVSFEQEKMRKIDLDLALPKWGGFPTNGRVRAKLV